MQAQAHLPQASRGLTIPKISHAPLSAPWDPNRPWAYFPPQVPAGLGPLPTSSCHPFEDLWRSRFHIVKGGQAMLSLSIPGPYHRCSYHFSRVTRNYDHLENGGCFQVCATWLQKVTAKSSKLVYYASLTQTLELQRS